ncbi:MAG: hypothetical protein GXP32_03050 [Kiritimatiellaeota bacterium]|nr:hypothetical protein [Kiritimatiellota bacterium]
MTKQNNHPNLNDTTIGTLRALDAIMWGSCLFIPLILINSFILSVAMPYSRYLYILPLFIIVKSAFKIPMRHHASEEWRSALWRLRATGCVVLAFSPFWAWWDAAPESRYLFANVAGLLLTLFVFIHNFVTLASITAKLSGWPNFFQYTKFTRMAIIYIMIAPVLAFFIAAWHTNTSNWELMFFIFGTKTLLLPIVGLPVVMSLHTLVYWRQTLSRLFKTA